MTQTQAVLALLRQRGDRGITALDALDAVGSFRLAARIHDLTAEGFQITSTMEATPAGRHIARYRLVERTPASWRQQQLPL
jgi:predicted ArsR family transcriptional regulator